MPSSTKEWTDVADQFDKQWNFPHCLGSMDGKHIILQSPIKSGTEYYNNKSFFSIVLFALVDANYNFIYANVGCQGRISDGGVFKNCDLYKKIANNSLKVTQALPLPQRSIHTPFVFVADKAFSLSEIIMIPFSGTHSMHTKEQVFIYRLSRCRRVVENVFGICSSIFRVLRKPLLLEPEKAEIIVMTIVYLHNFLRKSSFSRNTYTPPGCFDSEDDGRLIEGYWRQNDQPLQPLRNNPRRSTITAKEIRDEFATYFIENGALPWQNNYA